MGSVSDPSNLMLFIWASLPSIQYSFPPTWSEIIYTLSKINWHFEGLVYRCLTPFYKIFKLFPVEHGLLILPEHGSLSSVSIKTGNEPRCSRRVSSSVLFIVKFGKSIAGDRGKKTCVCEREQVHCYLQPRKLVSNE
jgi:hypothetical protein